MPPVFVHTRFVHSLSWCQIKGTILAQYKYTLKKTNEQNKIPIQNTYTSISDQSIFNNNVFVFLIFYIFLYRTYMKHNNCTTTTMFWKGKIKKNKRALLLLTHIIKLPPWRWPCALAFSMRLVFVYFLHSIYYNNNLLLLHHLFFNESEES